MDEKTLELAGIHYTKNEIDKNYDVTFEQFLSCVKVVRANMTYNFRGALFDEAKQIFQ